MKKLLILSFSMILIFTLWGCDALEEALNDETEEDPPSKPSVLHVELTDENTINLTWQDNADVEDGFIIEARVGSGSWEQVGDIGRNRSSFTFDEVEENVTYNFRIKAYNEAGDSDWYTSSDLDIPIFSPTELSGYGEDETIILEWNDNSSIEEGYKIQRRGASGGTWTNLAEVETDVDTYTDEEVEVNTEYEYRVCAYTGQDLSDYSNNVTASTASTPTDVNAPSSLTAESTGTQVNLSWTDNSDNEDAFIIERMSSGNNWSVIETTTADVTSFEDANVVTDIEYSYRVKARAGAAYSGYSNISTITINSTPSDLETPTNLDGEVFETGVDLTWDYSSSEANGFYVQRSMGSEGWNTIAEMLVDVTSYTDEHIMPTSTYHYRVQAFGQDDEVSDFSNMATFTIPFFAPTNLQATFSEEENFIHLTWIDNSDIEQGYEIYVRINGGEWHIRESLYDSNATQFIDYDFSAGNYHEYRVAAIWEDEIRSDFSNTSDVTIPEGNNHDDAFYFSDFEDDTVGETPQADGWWNYSMTDGVSIEVSDEMGYDSNQSVKFVDSSTEDSGYLSMPLENMEYNIAEINFKLQITQEYGTLAFVPQFDNDDWHPAAFLQFEENGQVIAIDGEQTLTVMEDYNVDEWCDVSIELNMEARVYTIVINGNIVADHFQFISHDGHWLGKLEFHMWNDRSLTNGAFVDDFELIFRNE